MPENASETLADSSSSWLETLVCYIERKPLYSDTIQHSRPILPTEQTLYDSSSTDEYNGSHPLALPKLNLQYLTAGDFLSRCFTLYRLEAFYEIRKHLEDTIKRLQPRLQSGNTRFEGFSRMLYPFLSKSS